MKTLNQIITEHFKVQEKEIADTLTAKDIPGWDSMSYLLFIAEVEKEFNISFSMDEVLNMQTLGDIKNALRKKGANV